MNKLSKEDEEVIKYLAKYKIMRIDDTKIIYKTEWYHRIRVKKLIEAGYVKKYKFYYIELDREGRKHLRLTGKDYIKNKSNNSYMERLKGLSKIATITINSNIIINPSWLIKDKEIYTDMARKYLAELIVGYNKYLIYYISDKKEKKYIHQLVYDISKVLNYEQIIIFIEKFDNVIEELDNLIFGKLHTYLVINSKAHRNLIKNFANIEFYELVKSIYGENREILISDWKLADFIIDKNHYVKNMIFIDTEFLSEINWFYQENTDTKKKLDILTLDENVEIVRKIVSKNINIIGVSMEKIQEEENFEKMEFKFE